MLGYDLPSYLPALFLLLAFLFMFDCIKKFLKCLGFEVYEFSLENHNEATAEGIKIMEEEERVFVDDMLDKEEKRSRQATINQQGLDPELKQALLEGA